MDDDNSHSSNCNRQKKSTSSSTLTDTIRNPYDRTSRRKESNSHNNSLNESSTNNRYGNDCSTIETEYKGLHEALNNFYQVANDNSKHNEDLNTSFSTASTAVRQMKLLRKATYELQNAVQWEQKSGDLMSLTMRGTGTYHSSSIAELPLETSSLIVETVNSVIDRLMEEYCNVYNDSNAAITTNDPKLNWNCGAGVEHHQSNEVITTALEFLNIAFGCLECDAVFGCLNSKVDYSMNMNDYVPMNDNGSFVKEKASATIVDALLYFSLSESSKDEQITELRHKNNFALQEVDISEPMIENNNRNQEIENSALFQSNTQLLALCSLTKAILCVEFIQKYCTSTVILPNCGIDSALGEDLGIGIDGVRIEKVAKLAIQFVCNMKTNSLPKDGYSSQMSYTSRRNVGVVGGNHIVHMACINLLGALFRTGINSCVESPLLKDLTVELSKSIQIFEHNSFSLGDNNGAHPLHLEIIHASAISFLALLDWNSHMLKLFASEEKRSLLSNEAIKKLLSIVLTEQRLELDDVVMDPDVTRMDDCVTDHVCTLGSAVQILIHLCITRNEGLHSVISNNNDLFSSMKGLQCITDFESDPLRLKGKCEGILLTMLYLNESCCRQSRKLMNNSLNRQNLVKVNVDRFDDKVDCNTSHVKFVEGLIELGKVSNFSLSVLSMALLRAMVNQDLPLGPLNDALASKLWQALCGPVNVFELSCYFFRSILSQRNLKASKDVSSSPISHLPLMCATIDFLSQLCKSAECCKVILDSAFSNDNKGLQFLLCVLDTCKKSSLRSYDGIIRDHGVAETKTNKLHSSLFYAVQLGVGILVSRLCFSCADTFCKINEECGGDKKNYRVSGLALLRRTLKRFTKNFTPMRMQDGLANESSCGVLNLAISQAISRDLTKRALNLQAALLCLQGDDEVFIASTIFSSARQKKILSARSMELESQYERNLNKLREENEMLSKQLSKERDDLAQVNNFFEHQITFSIVEAKADAVEHAEIQAEGKRNAEQRLLRCRDQLINVQNEKNQQETELEKQRTIANELESEIARCDNKIRKLENSNKVMQEVSADNKQKLITRENELVENQSIFKKLKCKLLDEEEKGSVLNKKIVNLKQTHSLTYDNLEDKFCTLITLTQLYEGQEKERKKIEFDLSEKLKSTEAYANKIIQKYSRLGERFKSLENKNYELSYSLEKANKNKINRASTRKPIGTMEYANSIHDKSQRKYIGKENESSFFSSRNLHNQRSSRKGIYKTVK